MSKFTKGPWFLDGLTIYALQDCLWLGIPSKENRFFASVQGPKCTDEELKATAELMMEAPYLYNALDILCKLDEHDVFTKDAWDKAFSEAREVLAKVDGKGEEHE
jgi:hypothetical protein